MLALEHKATVFSSGGKAHVVVKAQPFGSAEQIHNLASLQARMARSILTANNPAPVRTSASSSIPRTGKP
jgi:hypothetical protein